MLRHRVFLLKELTNYLRRLQKVLDAMNVRPAAAVIVKHGTSALAAFYRGVAARRGKGKALTALAHKLASMYYQLMQYGWEYVELRGCLKSITGRCWWLLAGLFVGPPHPIRPDSASETRLNPHLNPLSNASVLLFRQPLRIPRIRGEESPAGNRPL